MPSIQSILFIFMIVVMFFSILVGLIQGFKKNMYYFIATIVFWIIFWCTAPLIKGTYFYYNQNFYYSIMDKLPEIENSETCICLMDYIKLYIAKMANIDAATLNDPGVANTIVAIVQCVLKIVYLFVLAIIYWIIKVILYHSVFKKWCKASNKKLRELKKEKEKLEKKYNVVSEVPHENNELEKVDDENLVQQEMPSEKEEKPNKQILKIDKKIAYQEKLLRKRKVMRPLGMVSGLMRGLLSSFLIVCVFNSLVRLLPEDNKSEQINASTTNNNTAELNIYDFILSYCGEDEILKETVDLIKDYRSSTLMKITGIKVGNKAVDELFIDSILSGKSEDYSFALREELSGIVQIAENAYFLTNGFDMENFNALALDDTQVTYVKNILNLLSNDHLVQNLGSVLVGVSISLDAVSPYIPENISSLEYENIDWQKELRIIADTVGEVYSLGDDLSKLNYFDLNTDTVEKIIENLSSLQSINLLGHIGSSFAIKQLDNDNQYTQNIQSIENKLAQLALNNGYGQLVHDYSDLYTQFSKIYHDEMFEKYKDEDGKINNYIAALTSQKSEVYSNIVNTIFETNFVREILPDVMSILKEEYIPAEYASLINPNIVTSDQYKNEINALLKIIGDITIEKESGIVHPFETIETYDFALLRNFSVESVVESELLSYAMIKIFIDTSQSKGILSNATGDFANYICVPDQLANEYHEDTHRFAEKWYGNKANNYHDGELYIMLNTIKNCAAQIDNIKYPANSISNILSSINANELMQCDTLYYSLSSLLKNYQDMIIIPVDCTQVSADTVNGIKNEHMVKRDAIVEILNILTNPNIFDIEQLYEYFKINADGSIAEEPTDKSLINSANINNYIVKISLSENKLLSLLTSKKLYNPANGDMTNLNTLFKSKILRATITKLLNENIGEFIAIPKNSLEEDVECLVLQKNEDGTSHLISQNIGIIRMQQFQSLIMAIDDLKIDLSALIFNPIDIVDSLTTNDGKLKPQVEPIFTTSTSKYCGILHATLSKYVLDFANNETGGLKIVVPSTALQAADETLISSNETINLLRSLAIVGSEMFDSSSSDSDALINNIIDKVINNHEILDSIIIRATLTEYINSSQTITIPTSACDENNITKKEHIVDMLDAFAVLKEVKENQSGHAILYTDLLDIESFKISMLKEADSETYNQAISKSLILRGILTDQIENINLIVPLEAKDENNVISQEETHHLIFAISTILNENDSLSQIQLDTLKIGKLKEGKNDLKQSIIVRSLISNELLKQEATICIPQDAYDSTITSSSVITENELEALIEGMVQILGEESTINQLQVENIEVGKICLAKQHLLASHILNATITNQLKKIESIKIPNVAYEDPTSKEILTKNEIQAFINTLTSLFEEQTLINNLPINNITFGKLNLAIENMVQSTIFKATITSQINEQKNTGVLLIPNEAYDENQILLSNEISVIFKSLSMLFGENTSINNISDFSSLSLASLAQGISEISKSLILRSTITNELRKVEVLKLPASDVESLHQGNEIVYAIKQNAMSQLFNALNCMNITQINNLNIDSITIKDENKDIITQSKIMRATISYHVKVNDHAINALKDDVTIEKDYKNQDLLIINEIELSKIIEAVNVLAENGSINISFNMETLIMAARNGKLTKLLNSNTLRIVISDLIINAGYLDLKIPQEYVGDYQLECVVEGALYKFKDPVDAETYQLGSEDITLSSHSVLTKEDIIAYLTYLASLVS